MAVPPMDISTTAGACAWAEIHSKPAMIWAMLPLPSQSITRTARSSESGDLPVSRWRGSAHLQTWPDHLQ